MIKQIYGLARQLLLLIEDVGKIKAEQKELREELRELAAVVQELRFEVRQNRSDEVHEREKLVLGLENVLLKFERRLPPASPASEPGGTE